MNVSSSSTTKHNHRFDQEVTSKVLLFDERDRAANKSMVSAGFDRTGATVGFDLIKQHKCLCGAVRAYDLERNQA